MTTLTANAKRHLARAVTDLRPRLIGSVRTSIEGPSSNEAWAAGARTGRDEQLERTAAGAAAAVLLRQVLARQLETIGVAQRLDRPAADIAADLVVAVDDRRVLDMLQDSVACARMTDDRLGDPELTPAWHDPTTLGWVHQFWNDPERIAIDARLEAQGKLEGRDIAAKTQLYTERYMVEWLLANSLGHAWLCICERNGWRPEASRVLDALAARRAEWRRGRDAEPARTGDGTAVLDASEQAWALYLPRAITAAAVARSPASVTELRLLDPACGTGHFLVAAFDLLVAMQREEARHRGVARPDAEIARAIVSQSLHGVDIDARAVRIARAILTMKCWALGAAVPNGGPHIHASPHTLGSLRKDDETLTRQSFDLVVGNPPYFGTQSLGDSSYLDQHYPESKENLCTAMVDRALELVRPGGRIAFVTARSWLYVSQLAALRRRFFATYPPAVAADLGLGGFESLPGVEVVLWVAEQRETGPCLVVAAGEASPAAKEARLRCPDEVFETEPADLMRLPGSPFAYRWPRALVADYLRQPLLGSVAPVRVGMKTSDNLRFVRRPWELAASVARDAVAVPRSSGFAPYVKGAAGKVWIEPLSDLVDWRDEGLAIRIALDAAYGSRPQGEAYFFEPGVAFSTIGRRFIARAHRYRSIFDVAGSSVVTDEVPATVCLLNSARARQIVEALNPTVNFQVGDVARIPFRRDPAAGAIFGELARAFDQHEAVDERSFHFSAPGPSSWRSVQQWAQRAVDRDEGQPLVSCVPEWDATDPGGELSFAVGVALGRFGAAGEGWLDRAPESALPAGILYLSVRGPDSLERPACSLLRERWHSHGGAVGAGLDLRAWLRRSFAADHRQRYEGRPIYLPLASARRSFVAHVSIHRWDEDTLQVLLRDHLAPERRELAGAIEQLGRGDCAGRAARAGAKRQAELARLLDELDAFMAVVREVAERGPRQVAAEDPPREADARFRMALEDGVMVNAAALWPLCAPLWSEPKKWWQQLARRAGPKGCHFDWSQTAARYFPARVAAGCERDPALAVAHRCLWARHPAVAYRWEQDLRRSVAPDFVILEEQADRLRSSFLREQPEQARAIAAAVSSRRPARRRAGAKATVSGRP